MPYPRKPLSEITPEWEDAGLFKRDLCQMTVELLPQMSRNSRGDLRVRGFAGLSQEIEVLFAGRRTKDVAALERRLKNLLARARKAASAAKQPAPDVDNIRLPVRIEGAWRSRFKRDKTGWESRSYHLVAARWSMLDQDGNAVTYGAPPSI